MPFPPFRDHQIEHYKATISLKRYFNKSNNVIEDDRYTVIWYSKLLRNQADNSQVLISVLFSNIDRPNSSYQLNLELPFSFLPKIPIGSIWKNGQCNSKFKMEEEFQFTLDSDVRYVQTNEEISSLNKKFESFYPVYNISGNKHSIIEVSNINKNKDTMLIHPALFFMSHYGYSMEVNRLLLTLEWGQEEDEYSPNKDDFINTTLLKYENPDHQSINNVVYLPKNFVKRDSILLHFLKMNNQTKDVLKEFNKSIRNQIRKNQFDICLEVKPWHNDPIEIICAGIRLNDNTLLCTNIKGMSEPYFLDGDEINVMLSPSFKNPVDGIEGEFTGFFRPITRKEKLDDVELNPDHPANNLETALIKESIEILGRKWALIMHKDEIEAENNKKQALPSTEPSTYASGGVSNSQGDVGYAGFSFEDVDLEEKPFREVGLSSIRDGRIKTLWSHAKALSDYYENTIVEWFTYRGGFRGDDDIKLMSLEHICYGPSSYPEKLAVIRVKVNGNIFYILDSPIKENSEYGMSGVIVFVPDESDFLKTNKSKDYNGLIDIILALNDYSSGSLPQDYIDTFDGKLATFMHRYAENDDNNWIINGINKIYNT